MSVIYIGIDPGDKGGIAVVRTEGRKKVELSNMPDTYPEIYNMLATIQETNPKSTLVAILEDVGYGIPGQSSAATAKFARHNGHLEMALFALMIKTVKVTPQKWQKYFSNNIGKKDKDTTKTEWKNKLKQLAMQLYPELKITLNTADALLLAEYGKRNLL